MERDWLVLYDAECGFCRRSLSVLLRWDRGGHLRPVALHDPAAEGLLGDMAPDERMASWHLIGPDGRRWSAGAALVPLLRLLPGGRAPAAVFARFPRLTDRGYRWVAGHRSQLSRLLGNRRERSRRHIS